MTTDDPRQTRNGRLLNAGDELLRVCHVRGEEKIHSHSNRGPAKGMALEQARLVYQKNCQYCGNNFKGIGKAAYCSNACRQKAKRQRIKGVACCTLSAGG